MSSVLYQYTQYTYLICIFPLCSGRQLPKNSLIHYAHGLRLPSLYGYAPPFAGTQLRPYSTRAQLTHLDEHGRASMVDVSDKVPTKRSATASGRIYVTKTAYELITSTYPETTETSTESKAVEKARRKGDALTIAQLAGIMGAKRTADLIPLCHPLALSKVDVKLLPEAPCEDLTDLRRQKGRYSVLCAAVVTCEGKTGVEMEALTAVSVSLLTVWDMLKAVAGRDMEIGEIIVNEKLGGKSGHFTRTL